MSAFATLVWKEWRDHRTPLLAFPLLVPPVIALGVSLLPAGFAKDPALPTFVLLGCFAVAMLTLVADLIPGEDEKGTIALLRRLPSGLPKVFVAKTAFALLAAGALCGVGYLTASITSAIVRGGPWFPAIELGKTDWYRSNAFETAAIPWAWFALILSPWILAASAWIPRGALALPAAACMLALAGSPIVLGFLSQSGMLPTVGEAKVAISLFLAAPAIAAATAFTLGRRHGGGCKTSLVVALLSVLAVFVPGYAWTAWKVHDFLHLDPDHPSFRIADPWGSAFLGSSGEYAFLSTQHGERNRGPLHAIVVNLEDGSWRELGRPGEAFTGFGNTNGSVPVPYVVRRPEDVRDESARLRCAVIDTESLESMPEDGSRWSLQETLEKSRFARIASGARLPGGRRAWLEGNQLMTQSADGSTRELPGGTLEGRSGWAIPAGHGLYLRLFDDSPRSNGVRPRWIYDALRERRFEVSETFHEVWVRRGRWIVEREKVAQGHRVKSLFDPETGELELLPEAIVNAEFHAVLDDGRMLALVRDPTRPKLGTICVIDPDSGEQVPLDLPTWIGGTVQERSFRVEGWTPSGAAVVSLMRPDLNQREWHARLDLAEQRLAVAGDFEHPGGHLLGCHDEETLILVEQGRRLVRARFGDPRVDVLFPRSRP